MLYMPTVPSVAADRNRWSPGSNLSVLKPVFPTLKAASECDCRPNPRVKPWLHVARLYLWMLMPAEKIPKTNRRIISHTWMDEFVGELTCETFHFRTEPCLSDAARKLPGLLLIHSRQPIPPPACIPPGARVNDSSPRHETNEINPMHGQQNHLKDA